MNRRGVEQQRIYLRSILEEASKVVVGAAMATATEETMTTTTVGG